ncbi:C40 family peptidase [uncultured Clostridium sp.]|uniref:C40 family peptidase n=1 Tax=uncultured Clostridium sp. TaxID=59620 RepID=UPI0025830692|nr:C40 family peptidase [uncultured Clostridium sp.]
MKKKLLVALIFAITMSASMFSGITTAFADTPNTVQAISADKAQQQQKAIETQEQIEKLDNQIQNSMMESQSLNNKIAEANNNIASLQTQISNTQAQLNANKEKMNQEIKGLYEQGYANNGLLAYLNVLFSGKSFSQIVTNLQDIYSINQSNQKILKQIQSQESQLQSEKDSLQNNVNTLQASKNKIASNLAAEQNAKNQEQGLLSSIKDTIAKDSAQEIALQKQQVQAALKADAEKQAKENSSAQKSSSNSSNASSSAKSSSSSNSNSSSSNSNSSNSKQGSTMIVSTASGNVVKSTAGNTQYVPNGAKASASAEAVIAEAEKFIGVPYVWGGESPSGFDCSGLMQYVFGAEGVSLPRTAAEQQECGTPVAKGDLQPGDLIFWGEPAYHVAMYIGNGEIIAAPHTGAYVTTMPLYPYTNARRVL